MALSARNHLQGTVVDLNVDGLMAEVVVELSDGERVTSIVTSSSIDRLGLKAGDEVDAVVKATDVIIEN